MPTNAVPFIQFAKWGVGALAALLFIGFTDQWCATKSLAGIAEKAVTSKCVDWNKEVMGMVPLGWAWVGFWVVVFDRIRGKRKPEQGGQGNAEETTSPNVQPDNAGPGSPSGDPGGKRLRDRPTTIVET